MLHRNIQAVLNARLSPVPQVIYEALDWIHAQDRLTELLCIAATARTLEELEQALRDARHYR